MFFALRKNPILTLAELSAQVREIISCIDVADRKLSRNAFIDGRPGYLDATTGTVSVVHGLGRVPQGWLVTRATDALPSIYETARDVTKITFSKATAAVLELWIF